MDVKITKDDFPVLGTAHKAGTVLTVSTRLGRKIIAAGAGKDVAGQIEPPETLSGATEIPAGDPATQPRAGMVSSTGAGTATVLAAPAPRAAAKRAAKA